MRLLPGMLAGAALIVATWLHPMGMHFNPGASLTTARVDYAAPAPAFAGAHNGCVYGGVVSCQR